MKQHEYGRRAGFTIVELIVVIAVMGVLMAVLLPALAGVRRTARKTNELSAARQLMVGYLAYAANNNDRVLVGYLPGLDAYDEAGVHLSDRHDASDILAGRYPWRLAPYLDYSFEGLYLNEQGSELEQMRAGDPVSYLYAVSLYPSLGLNSMWVGGHQGLGLRTKTDPGWVDYFGSFYVRSLSEVRRADELLVFASARRLDPVGAPVEGSFDIHSPYRAAAEGRQWADTYADHLSPEQYGNLSMRYRGAVTAFIDGHTDLLSATDLADMRHWARDANRADWGLEVVDQP